jgi:hypothetical protein
VASVGVDLEYDTLVLYKGRDFRWSFQNLDVSRDPINFPAGDLFFELATGNEHNARQSVIITGAAGGTYTLGVLGQTTSAIPWDASELVVQERLEALSTVGYGNVQVTGSYIPQWIFEVTWTTPVALTPGIIQAFNFAMNTAMDGMEFWLDLGLGLIGRSIDIEGEYTPTSFIVKVTAPMSLLETEFVNLIVESVEAALDAELGLVEAFVGNIGDINEFYAPIRTMHVEFWGDLALTPIPDIVATPTLTGSTPLIQITADARGRAPVTIWPFVITGSTASAKVESEEVAQVKPRTRWQLVFLPDGEAEGGDPIALGSVEVRGAPHSEA